MCMCYQYQRASLSANETICFTRTKTLVIKVRYPAIINFSKSIYSSFRELWENTTKQIKNRPLKYFLDHVRSSKSDELFNSTTGNQHAGGLCCGTYWGFPQMLGNYPPLTLPLKPLTLAPRSPPAIRDPAWPFFFTDLHTMRQATIKSAECF